MKLALLVIVLHGGGWTTGSPDSMRPAVESLRTHGVPAVSVPYRLDGFPHAAADVKEAICQARRLADRVMVYGFSAGGTLAAYAAASGWADAAVVESAPVDFITWRSGDPYFGQPAHMRAAGLGSPAAKLRWSPVRRWRSHTPVLALYGDHDVFVPLSQGRQIARRPRVEFHVKRGGQHQVDERYRAKIASWLKSHT